MRYKSQSYELVIAAQQFNMHYLRHSDCPCANSTNSKCKVMIFTLNFLHHRLTQAEFATGCEYRHGKLLWVIWHRGTCTSSLTVHLSLLEIVDWFVCSCTKNMWQSRESYSIPKLAVSDCGIPWTMQYHYASRWWAWENIRSMKNKFFLLKGVKYMSDLGSIHLPQWQIQWQEKPYFCIKFPWTVFSFFIFLHLQLTELTSLIMVCKEKL